MRPNPILLITLLLGICSIANGQNERQYQLSLNNGKFIPSRNIDSSHVNAINKKRLSGGQQLFSILQFETLPTVAERAGLEHEGITLLDYVPGTAYTAIIKKPLQPEALVRNRVRAIIELTPQQKMQSALASGIIASRYIRQPGTIDVWISFIRTAGFNEVSAELRRHNFDLLPCPYSSYRIAALRIPVTRLQELAALPIVEYVQGAPGADVPLNNISTSMTRANVMHSTLPGGRNLQGAGVVVGVGDNTGSTNHVDFGTRVIDRSAAPSDFHGTHVMGTLAGAGFLIDKYAGYAPKARLLSQLFSTIFTYAPAYVHDYDMVITNNSYANVVDDCNSFGTYDLYSRVLDQIAFDFPNLQNVFAAGNSGDFDCGYYPGGFCTVMGGYQTAKNVITVGNLTSALTDFHTSSRGPVKDGRVKPELVAYGTGVISTVPVNSYDVSYGTSMAAPAISGGLALLYERYRQLHGNADPPNGLMKTLLCNGATDLGNTGPDYSYGFGVMNLLRSVTMLEQDNYFTSSVVAGGQNTHSITIPAGASIAKLKVMLYWNDSAAAALATHALVNDLDLEVTDPFTGVHLPYLLDTSRNNITNAAATGADHINNIEQVEILNPTAGTYTFTVKGTTIPFAAGQSYYLAFDTIGTGTHLTYPIGGESFEPGENILASWDSYGNTSNDFLVEYFDGSTWTTMSNPTPAGSHQVGWTIPNIVTDQARVRITHNGTGEQDISAPFTIIGTPAASLTADQCEGYIKLSWPPVTGASDYEVMMVRGNDMVPVATVAGSPYVFAGLSKDSVYWVTVRARINGEPGRRAIAISRTPNDGTCSGTISDNDLKIDQLLSPVSGRELTSTALTAGTPVTVRIKNLDDAAVNNFALKYSVNGAAFVSETVAATVPGGATYDHSFTASYDFSAVGNYTVEVVVENLSATDPVTNNDTLTVLVKHLPNKLITLTLLTGYTENFDTIADSTYFNGQMGLADTARYDFVSTLPYGRLRTFVNTGIAYSGDRALTLDADRYYTDGVADSLKATYNLSAYSTATDDVRLDFMYTHHGQVPDAANNVWIRGNDQQPWIPAYDLYAGQLAPGVYKRVPSIELSDLLAANSQSFSSSFQVKWGQWGQAITADPQTGAGYTFDDIHLYMVNNDVQMLSIDTPIIASCGLGSAVPVQVTVRNSSNSSINSIPVKLQVDNGAVITEMIAAIAGNAEYQYTFTATANLSASGNHTIKAWVDLASDTYHANDTTESSIYNSPVITSFPYLQNFEGDDGGWHAAGANSSWEYGTPASFKIGRAASGIKAWKTRLAGTYNDQEQSYLYSPCFNILGMANPTLSLSIALDLEDCGGTACDGAYVEYSADGKTWTRLGANGQGTNWYNKNYAGNNLWSIQDYTHWHVATIPLPTGLDQLRLRFVMRSDPYVNKEGIAIDDIHIYDNPNGIYTAPPSTSAVATQVSVAGTGWIDFTTGGKLIASVNPNGQSLGSTDAQAYINTGAVRVSSGQYYHDRNITIKPTNVNLADSVSVRFYFLDTETEVLLNATGCTACSKPGSAYELGVSKYSDADDNKENGTLADNNAGNWLYILPANCVKVPFDKGYYAEFKVKDFSEFWLNNGGIPGTIALPLELLNFNANKLDNADVRLVWQTTSENNTSRFEIEVADGNEAFRQQQFVKLGTVAASGNSSTQQEYSFIDQQPNKAGTRYYRLRMIDRDGRSTYSLIRPVVFDRSMKAVVYPNPTDGLFNFVFQANEKAVVQLRLYDAAGKLVKQLDTEATGFVQKLSLSLAGRSFTAGIYLLDARIDGKSESFRVLKK